jgi:hypothetical protein
MTVEDDRLEALYDTTLVPRIEALEQLRLSLKSYITKAAILIGIPVGVFVLRGLIGAVLPESVSEWIGPVAFVGIFVGVIIAGKNYLLPGMTAYANYNAKFKQDIVAEIFKVVCPTATYSPNQGIASSVFDEAGIFSTSGSYASDDRVRGKIGQTPFVAAESKRTITTGSGKDEKTYTVFHGLFFHFDFNKKLNGVTIVQPESPTAYQIGSRKGLNLVTFEDPDFEREFKVYASNDIEARYVLTPAMMARLMKVRAEAGKPIFMAFREHGAYLGIHFDRALFEPGIAVSTSKDAVLEMADHFALADDIVRELDLNTRIWTKDVDESLLNQPDQEKVDPLLALAAAKAGTLTEQELWTAAKKSVGEDYESETGKEIAKPANSRIRIDSDGAGSMTVRYPWSYSFYIMLLVTAVAVAVAFSALHQLAGSTLAAASALIDRLPTYAPFDRLVGDNGLVWLAVAAGVGGLFSLGWLLRVYRVVVRPDEVRVYRGFSPVAHRYPRPEYSSILRMKNSVHVSKGEGVTLINPTASPNVSEAEAGWVACELRKALQA